VTTKLRVVIVGAGFAGLEVARALRGTPADVTLIDRQNHHLFQPLLYQVATAALSPGDIAWPIRSVFRRDRNVNVLLADVTGIDPGAQVVTAGGRAFPYDALVVATGATHAYFGHEEWAPHAPGLKTIADATAIRRRVLLAFERAELTQDPLEQTRLLTFVVVGGGPTGVEMAGALADLARQGLRREFRNIDPGRARTVLVEAGSRILPAFPESLSSYAEQALTRIGVEVRTGRAVTSCDAAGVVCGTETIPAATIVWAAGVTASPVGALLDTPRDRAGRVRVAPDLSLPGHKEIFVAGDLAAAVDGTGRPVPGNAPAAKQMGQDIGLRLAARASGRRERPPFAYRHHGDLATIGRRAAVVSIGRFRLTGWLGWWFWGIAHVVYLIGFRSRVIVSFEWLWSHLTFQRGARLITTPAPGSASAIQADAFHGPAAPRPPVLPPPLPMAAGGIGNTQLHPAETDL